MEKIVCKNSFDLSVTFEEKFPYFKEKVEGIHTKASELYGTKSAFGIGELYSGSSVNRRNILIYGYFKDNFIERRHFLYNMFPNDDLGTLYYYENDFSAKINYRVEKVDISDEEPICNFVISLICFEPYFSDIEETKFNLTSWEGGLAFPLEIPEDGLEFERKSTKTFIEAENPTNIASGLTILFKSTGTVKRPTIRNVMTEEELVVDIDMEIDDMIKITTHRNNKNIILIRDGIEKNINNFLLYGTKFLQLNPGSNIFKILSQEGINNLETEISYVINYEAI